MSPAGWKTAGGGQSSPACEPSPRGPEGPGAPPAGALVRPHAGRTGAAAADSLPGVAAPDDADLRRILGRAAAAGLDPERVAIALGLPPDVPATARDADAGEPGRAPAPSGEVGHRAD